MKIGRLNEGQLSLKGVNYSNINKNGRLVLD